MSRILFSDSRHNSYWKSFISPSPPLSPAELLHSFQGLAGRFLVLGLLVILLWGIFVSCRPSERHGFCFLGKLLLFPGQRHVPASGLWLIHGWTWRLWTSQLSPSLQLHTQPFLYMLTDVWLLGFKETFWVTYACFPEALLCNLLVC